MPEAFDDPRSPYFRQRTGQTWIDTMQVCEAGHLITRFGVSQPESLQKRCSKCGAKTITACPKCNATIPGHKHYPGVAYVDSAPLPDYCNECGEAFPWQMKPGQGKTMPTGPTSLDKIFVVHGHDEEMKQAVARAISSLGLEPIILHEQPNEGKTIIEKFEKHADVGFAIVLLSPDDLAFPSGGNPKTARPRARQNVVLELGYFAGRLGRSKVFSLHRAGSNLELPSDIAGVAYTSYDSHGNWRLELVKELKAGGYNVDANKLV
jgi:predicted nucleotide-binding protein